ncbi:MAG: nucleotidyltransferase family protein [Minisyncoccia bacterium]
MQPTVDEIAEKARPVFEKYGVTRAQIFGSFARGEATPKSDVDILVKIDPQMGLYSYMDLKEQLEQNLEREVDVVAEGTINKFMRPYIVPELKMLYEKE